MWCRRGPVQLPGPIDSWSRTRSDPTLTRTVRHAAGKGRRDIRASHGIKEIMATIFSWFLWKIKRQSFSEVNYEKSNSVQTESLLVTQLFTVLLVRHSIIRYEKTVAAQIIISRGKVTATHVSNEYFHFVVIYAYFICTPLNYCTQQYFYISQQDKTWKLCCLSIKNHINKPN